MLRTTHTSSVTEDQIDHLGHMNVRFYAVNALAGTRAVLADLPGWDGQPHMVHDTYTRHHREQLLGTRLVVRSAVLGGSEHGIRLHHELASDEGVMAATFVHRVSPAGPGGERLPVPDAAVAAARSEAVAHPDYAAARTVSLDADLLATAPDLATVQGRGLAFREERQVTPAECDDAGRYRVEMAPLIVWAGESSKGPAPDHLHETGNGELMAWASMETRAVFGALPTLGARVQSFGATVGVHDKVLHRVNWAFDLDTGELLMAFESVSMAFDIRSRRPMSIPEGYRRLEQDRVQPDLVPHAVA